LIVAFHGEVSLLVPLFAVGLFASFTLSQAGMVVHHFRLRERGWTAKLVINAFGAVATTVVTVVILVSKFTEGAWIPAVVIPLLVVMFAAIRRHYVNEDVALSMPPGVKLPKIVHTVVVLVPARIHEGTVKALAYAKSLHPHYLHAVHVAFDADGEQRMRDLWIEYGFDVALDIINSPYRELVTPITRYIDELDARWKHDVVTVILPEFVVLHWWEQLLHGQSALHLKARLLFRRGTVVTSVPLHID
jgi:hypothetical protein